MVLQSALTAFLLHSVEDEDNAMSITDTCLAPSTASARTRPGVLTSDRTLVAGWSIIAVAASIVSTAILTGRFSLGDTVLLKAFSGLATTGVCGMALRARGWVKAGVSSEIFSQFMLADMLAALVSVILASTDLPLQDDVLQNLDRGLLGFDWHWIIQVSKDCPNVMLILSYCYTSLTLQPLVLLACLFLLDRFHAAKTFCVAWVATLAISVAIFPLVPAVGGYLHNDVTQDQTHVLVAAAWRHVEILAPVRDGALRSLSADTLEGIITFPSFHAAAAVLLAWGFWHLSYVRWPALALNLAMLASTPFVGGHYLVDVAAGCVIAILTLIVATKWQRGTTDTRSRRDQARDARGDRPTAA